MIKEVMSIEQILNRDWGRGNLLSELNLPETPLGKGHSFNELIYLVVEKYHPGATATKEFQVLWAKNQIALFKRVIERDVNILATIPLKEKRRRNIVQSAIDEDKCKLLKWEKTLMKNLTTSSNKH